MKIAANITYDGRAREAFDFYRSLFGGVVETIAFGELPGMEGMPEAWRDRLAHVRLTIGDQVLMGGDMHWAMPYEPPRSVWVTLEVDGEAEARRVFEALSRGGQVGMPLGATSWSPAFGMVVDRFGAPFIVNAVERRL